MENSESIEKSMNKTSDKKEESMFSFLSSRKSDTLSETPNSEKVSDTLDKKSDITSMSSSPIEGNTMKSVSNTGGIMGFFSKINFTTILLVVIALAVLGFNIFSYLSDATETTSGILKPIIGSIYNFFGYAVTDTAKKTIEIGAKGAKMGVDVAAGTATSVIDTTQALALDDDMPEPTETPMPEDIDENVQKRKEIKKKAKVVSDDSQSVFQKSNSSKKAGWCFIGEDKGVRSCIDVRKGDKCVSNEIFPSRELCMNPGLRE